MLPLYPKCGLELFLYPSYGLELFDTPMRIAIYQVRIDRILLGFLEAWQLDKVTQKYMLVIFFLKKRYGNCDIAIVYVQVF